MNAAQTSHHRVIAAGCRSQPARLAAFSRLASSRSTASLMKPATGSFSSSTESIRSRVPFGKRAGICSSLICVLPMATNIDDITYCYKPSFC